MFGVNVLLSYVSRSHSLCLVCSAKIHRIEWFDIVWLINADVAELVLKKTTCKRLSRQSIYGWFIFVAFAPIHKAVVVSCLCVSTPTNSNLNGYLHHFFHFSALPLDIRWQLHFPCFTCEFIFRFSFADVYGVVTAAVAAVSWERAIDLDAFSISHNSMYRSTHRILCAVA